MIFSWSGGLHRVLPKIGMLHAVAGALDGSDNVLEILEWRDGDLFILEMNDAFRRMGDYRAQKLLGCAFAQLVATESEADVIPMREAAASGTAFRGELLAIARQGKRYWFGFHMMPCDVRAERVGLFVVLGRDITQRRAEAEQSAAVQTLLARVFMSADVPISILDAENRFAMTNPAHDRMLGGRASDWVGRPSLETVEPGSRARLIEAREQHLLEGTPFRIDVDLITMDGQRLPVRLTSTRVERSDRQHFRIVTVVPEPMRPLSIPHIKLHGKIKLISLAEVRDHLGTRYRHMAPRVMATANHVLEQRVGPHDHFLPTAEGDFCVWFAYLNEDEAELSGSAIGHEIRTKLIGDDASAVVVIEPPPAEPELPIAAPPPLLLTKLRAVTGGEIAGHFVRLSEWNGNRVSVDQKYLDGSHLERDLTCLRCALARASELGRLLVPVEFDHFMQRTRTERFFTSIRDMFAGSETARNLTIMFDHLPRGVVVGRLFELVHRIYPYGCGVGFMMEDLEPPTLEIPNAWFGIDARRFEGGAAFPHATLSRLCLQIHTNRGRVWIRNLANTAIAKQLVGMGVDYVSFEGD